MKKKYIDGSITVQTRKELADAIKARYRSIVVIGSFADELRKDLNKKHTGRKVGQAASWISLLAGLVAWPYLLVALAGFAITADDLANYTVSSAENTITLTIKMKK